MIKDEIACVSSLFIDVLTPECHALCKCQVPRKRVEVKEDAKEENEIYSGYTGFECL